jgi:hypothetical protein
MRLVSAKKALYTCAMIPTGGLLLVRMDTSPGGSNFANGGMEPALLPLHRTRFHPANNRREDFRGPLILELAHAADLGCPGIIANLVWSDLSARLSSEVALTEELLLLILPAQWQCGQPGLEHLQVQHGSRATLCQGINLN